MQRYRQQYKFTVSGVMRKGTSEPTRFTGDFTELFNSFQYLLFCNGYRELISTANSDKTEPGMLSIELSHTITNTRHYTCGPTSIDIRWTRVLQVRLGDDMKPYVADGAYELEGKISTESWSHLTDLAGLLKTVFLEDGQNAVFEEIHKKEREYPRVIGRELPGTSTARKATLEPTSNMA